MIHNITKEKYLNNPCRFSSVAYWKNAALDKPENLEVIHADDFDGDINNSNITKYFRLCHGLKDATKTPDNKFILQNVNIDTQLELVAEILSQCYECAYSTETINKWTKLKVFDNDLWILAIEKATILPVALGIADFDAEIKEGSLEWIQVLPQKRGLGLGELIVKELLSRLKNKADFVTVSGEIENLTKPEKLYRKCGFTGNDIWYCIKGIK